MTTLVARPSPVRSDLYAAEIPDGTSLSAVMGDVPESVRAQIDGEVIPRERWSDPLPADAQVLITSTPEDDGIGRAIAMIAVAVAAAYTGGAAAGAAGFAQGTAGYAAVSAATSAAVTMAGSLAVNALIPPEMPAQNDPGSATVRKSITGTRNQIDKYGVVPRVYGNPRWYPKLAANPVTEIAGNDQYMRMLLVLGYGPLEIAGNRVGAGHSVLKNASVGDAITIGETNLDEYEDVEWEIGTPDQLSLMTPDIAEEQVGVALNQTGEIREHEWVPDDVPPVVRTTAPNTREISMDLTFPTGLWVTTDTGDTRGCRVRYSIRYRRTGESAWTTLDDNWVITDHTKETKRVNRRWNVPAGQYDVELTRVATYLRDNNSPQTDSTWAVLRSVQEGPAYTGNHVLMALRIRATDQLNGVIDQLRIRTQAVLRVWDGYSWVMQATNNPGWAYIDAMTGQQVGNPITDDRLHIEDIATWAAFCDNQGLEYHHVHDGDETVLDRARSIAAGGQGSFAFRDGRFGIVFDDPNTPIVQAITPRNASGFSSSIQYKDLPHAIRVKYVDPNTWSDAERIVYRDGYDESNATRFEDFQLQGVASADEAWHHGQYHLRQAILRPETFQASMDWENLAIVRGNRVLYQYDAILVGLGSARVKYVAGNTITLDERLEYTEQRAYGISVRGVDDAQGRAKLIASQVTGAEIGETDTFTTVDSIDVEPGDLVIYGVMGRESIDAKVSKIQPNQDFGADLTLVNAAPDIYDYSTAPIFDPGITLPIDPSNMAPPVPQITSVRGDETAVNVDPSGTPQPVLRIAYEFPTRGGYPALDVEARYRQDDQTQWDSFGPTGASGHMSIPGIADQVTYIVQLRSRRGDRYSDWSDEATSGITGRPVVRPDGVDVEASNSTISLTPYGPYPNALWEFYRAQSALAPGNVESAAKRLGVGSQITDSGLQFDTTYYYYVRGWSASAVSGWYAVTAATTADFDELWDEYDDRLRRPGGLVDQFQNADTALSDRIDTAQGSADQALDDAQQALTSAQQAIDDAAANGDEVASIQSTVDAAQTAIDQLRADVDGFEQDGVTVAELEKVTQEINDLTAIQYAALHARTSGNAAMLDVAKQVQVTDKMALTQLIQAQESRIDDTVAQLTLVDTTYADKTSALSSRIGELSAKIDALPQFGSGFEPGADINQWIVGSNDTLAADTSDPFAGVQSGLITSTATSPNSSGTTGATYAAIPSGATDAFEGYEIIVSIAARQPASNAAAEFGVAYSTASVGNSGWQRFTPGANWDTFEFRYTVPEGSSSSTDYICIWGDTSGGGGGVVVDAVNVRRANAEITEITALLEDERAARVAGDEANAEANQTLRTEFEGNRAQVSGQLSTLSDSTQALTKWREEAESQIGDNTASVTENRQTLALNETIQTITRLALSATSAGGSAVQDVERVVRVDEERSISQSVQNLRADFEDNSAQIDITLTSLVTDTQSLAQDTSQLRTDFEGNKANVNNQLTALSNETQSLGQDLTNLETDYQGNKASVDQQLTALSDEAQTLAREHTALETDYEGNKSTVDQQLTALSDDTSAISQRIDNFKAEYNDYKAVVSQDFSAVYDPSTGAVARAVTTVNVNGRKGMLGIQVDGELAEIVGIADQFSILNPVNDELVTAFVVADGRVVMRDVLIGNAAVGTLQIAGRAVTIQAAAFQGGTTSHDSTAGVSEDEWDNVISVGLNPEGGRVFIDGMVSMEAEAHEVDQAPFVTRVYLRLIHGSSVIRNYGQVFEARGGAGANNITTLKPRFIIMEDIPTGSNSQAPLRLQIRWVTGNAIARVRTSEKFVRAASSKR